MISKPLAFGLLAAGCVTAAAGGAYLATRSNAADVARVQQQTVTAPAPAPSTGQPVSESEGLVTPSAPQQPETTPPSAVAERPQPAAGEPAPRPRSVEASPRAPLPRPRPQPASPPLARHTPSPSPAASAPASTDRAAPPADQSVPAPAPQGEAPWPEPQRPTDPPVPPVRQFEELVVPSASVIGLQVDTSVSSERARVEDRVVARVTRDVMAGNRVAIPAGARVLGTVTAVDRGGKVKERARLDVRFHTLVLADGAELPMRTETISRFGESPTGESARKIGGAAIGGAILGAILGGGKGAAIGGATGAAGGTAVVMAGDRNAATLPAGTILSVRLSDPVSIEVERQSQR